MPSVSRCLKLVLWEMLRTCLLACATNWLVVLVQNNADFLHKPDLLFIVALKVYIAYLRRPSTYHACVDLIPKKSQDVVRRDGLTDGQCRCYAHSVG
jgi:hypothetical protein